MVGVRRVNAEAGRYAIPTAPRPASALASAYDTVCQIKSQLPHWKEAAYGPQAEEDQDGRERHPGD
jgi:hypothetical protein